MKRISYDDFPANVREKMSKGDKHKPTDQGKWDKNYARIFGEKQKNLTRPRNCGKLLITKD